MGLFVVVDLAVTWTNYAALLTLSRLHAAATTDVQRAAYVAAANYASAVLASHTEVFYSIVDLSLAILVIGFVMLKGKGIFNRTTAYLGVVAGIFGIVSPAGFFNHNHQCRADHGLGLVCGLETLEAGSEVMPPQAR